MKVKTSVTLSEAVLLALDECSKDHRSRSDFVEAAVKYYIASLARARAERADMEILERNADRLNEEAMDVLEFQVPI